MLSFSFHDPDDRWHEVMWVKPVTFKVRGEQTKGALTAFETIAAPGDGPSLTSTPTRTRCCTS